MKKNLFIIQVLLCLSIAISAATFSGKVTDVNGKAIAGAKVLVVENNQTTTTDTKGEWSLKSDERSLTLVFHKDGYTYEQFVDQASGRNIDMTLREAKKSAATLREEGYVKHGCETVSIPNDAEWNVEFKISNLKGDLAPDQNIIRRDPSAVINVDGTYYMWYSYSPRVMEGKDAPWDLNDLYYATSKDGITWDEKGLAVKRGEAGSYDHRSVFTCEILEAKGKYYLVYQCAADENGIYLRNTVGMSYSDSPDGPWTKLDKPVLHPTYTNEVFFDNTCVHDPCIVPYNGKFHLYYKGECNCMDNDGCVKWCNPVCGLKKQVKWGVAISDNPTGPYVKSEFNPITNTGHEVMVWPYGDGMAILQHQDGPEAMSIQYAEDGFNFDIKGKVAGFPEAAGLARTTKSNTNPHAGIKWGVGHKLMWNIPGGWMYIYRFDKVGVETNIPDAAEPQSSVEIFPNPTDNTLNIKGDFDRWEISSLIGQALRSGSEAKVDVSSLEKAMYIISFDNGQAQMFSKI